MWIKTKNRLINLDNITDIFYAHSSITFSMVDGAQLTNGYDSVEEAKTAYNDLCSLLGINNQ